MLYSILLYRLFRRIGLAAHFSFRTIRLPWREVTSFCGPMLLTGLVAVATTEFAAIVVGTFGGAQQVADFRAVLPIAALNLGVLFSFTTLFAPSASRLYARESHQELRDLYWQNAIWVSVLTFPVLAVTTALAGPFTVFALGDRYASSAAVLAVLSVGYYINASWGFNGFTIQLIGRSRWVLVTNAVTLVVMVPTSVLLANLYGAIGGAVAVLVTLIVHNALKQAGLGFGGGIGIVHRAHARVLLQVARRSVLLALFDWLRAAVAVVGIGAGRRGLAGAAAADPEQPASCRCVPRDRPHPGAAETCWQCPIAAGRAADEPPHSGARIRAVAPLRSLAGRRLAFPDPGRRQACRLPRSGAGRRAAVCCARRVCGSAPNRDRATGWTC